MTQYCTQVVSDVMVLGPVGHHGDCSMKKHHGQEKHSYLFRFVIMKEADQIDDAQDQGINAIKTGKKARTTHV